MKNWFGSNTSLSGQNTENIAHHLRPLIKKLGDSQITVSHRVSALSFRSDGKRVITYVNELYTSNITKRFCT